MIRGIGQILCEGSDSGPDLEDDITLADRSRVKRAQDDALVDQKVLAEFLAEVKVVSGNDSECGLGIRQFIHVMFLLGNLHSAAFARRRIRS